MNEENVKTTQRQGDCPVKFEELHLSLRASQDLKRTGFDDMNKILEMPIRRLRHRIQPDRLIADILRQLDARGVRKTDCPHSRYPAIDDYIRENLKCGECHEALSDGADTMLCLCKSCMERLVRIRKDRPLSVKMQNPEYTSYDNGHIGVTLFAQLVNETDAPLKVKLEEFSLNHCGRHRLSDCVYTNYGFYEDYLFPKTAKAIGEIWFTEQWEKKHIGSGDYCVFRLRDKETDKGYFFKFVYDLVDDWRLYDYYEFE